MKKPTKSLLKRKLDKKVSEIVRSRGVCLKCGKSDYSKLQCCHIFSRRLLSVRFDFDNLLCLCAGCHFWSHANPVLFGEFVREYLGEIKYQMLKAKANSIKKWTLDELQDLLKAMGR